MLPYFGEVFIQALAAWSIGPNPAIACHRGAGAAIDARDAHIEMENLGRSIRDHSEVPATFDGEAPEPAYQAGDASKSETVT